VVRKNDARRSLDGERIEVNTWHNTVRSGSGSSWQMASRFVGTPYKQFRDTGPFDAIVVGSGIGGLGTAAPLAKAAG
jgi:ribulose 1,5-bisphosphate synthetase/thiazole synthase